MCRPAIVLAIFVPFCAAGEARAEGSTNHLAFTGGHVAYALGPAAGDLSGFRRGLDVGDRGRRGRTRVGGDVFLLEVGLHLLAIAVPDRDVVFAFTLGFGRD